MAKGSRGRRRIASRLHRPTPYPTGPTPFSSPEISPDLPRRCSKALDKKDWEDVTCSVCMEYPHNAVLLLCSSHDKGCRPYMCGTSFRHSNCLDQYKKAYAKVVSPSDSVEDTVLIPDSSWSIDKCEVTELACPLCRGQVKGWTVVEPAREYLNEKRRSCIHDDCSFVGTYRELRKHVRAEHPSARPREVDPVLEQKWRRLERERERDDVISTIRSTMPGAMVFGDYVIEGNHYGLDSDEDNDAFDADHGERNGGSGVDFDSNLMNVFFLLTAFGQSGYVDLGRRLRQPERTNHLADESAGHGRTSSFSAVGLSDEDDNSNNDDNDDANDNDNDDGDGDGVSLVSRLRRQGRVLLGRSGRRRRRREANGGRR